jgi:hypothetical protein
MSTDFGKLHHIDFAGEPGERISSRVVKMQIADEQGVPSLAEQGVEAGTADRPSEALVEWLEESQRMAAEGYIARTTRQVFSLMGYAGHAPFPVYPRGSEGEDFAGTHSSAEADEESEGHFATLGPWPFPRSEPEVAQESPDFVGMYDALAGWVISGGAEATEGTVLAPLPLVSSDGEDVAKEVHVALDAALRDYLETGIPPLGEVLSVYGRKVTFDEFCEVAQKCANAFGLKGSTLLRDADFVPVANKSFSERLTGYRPTLHRQNLGLLCSGPLLTGALSLEGARLANSVPRDLEFPPALDPSDVRHGRKDRRKPDGNNRDERGR